MTTLGKIFGGRALRAGQPAVLPAGPRAARTAFHPAHRRRRAGDCRGIAGARPADPLRGACAAAGRRSGGRLLRRGAGRAVPAGRPGQCRAERVCRPVEEPEAKRILELENAPHERRLRQREMPRGGPEGAGFEQRQKGIESDEIEIGVNGGAKPATGRNDRRTCRQVRDPAASGPANLGSLQSRRTRTGMLDSEPRHSLAS